MAKLANEIYINRLYQAPVSQVWSAWVSPQKVAHWWGPRGFNLTTVRKDVRTGGDWLYTMHGPNGIDYPNHTRFLEVEPFRRLVYDHGGFEDKPPLFRVTVSFKEINCQTEMAQTEMAMIMTLPSAEIASATRNFIREAGGDATWDRLAEFLEHELRGKEIFVINRTFECSPKELFMYWSNLQNLMAWLPPVGFAGRFLDSELKMGHGLRFHMSNSDVSFYGKFQFTEIIPDKKMIYRQVFTDQQGQVSRHPLAADWPETLQVSFELIQEEEGLTRVALKTEALGPISAQEKIAFCDGRAGMTLGWTGSFDKLEKLIRI